MVSAPRPDVRAAAPARRPDPAPGLVTSAPFARVPDPRSYVARPACEEALAALLRSLDEGVRVAMLEGPSGIGKSLLLRVLEGRLDARFEVVRLPLAGASFDELAALALAGLDQRSAARVALTLEDAARRLRTVERVLVVTVDDATRLSAEAAEGLGRALRAGRGALRAVLAVETGAARPRLPGGTRTIRLAAPMSAEETSRYVEARLGRAGDPRLARTFAAPVVAELHARSGGVPGVLHGLAEEILEAAHPPAAALGLPAPPEPFPGTGAFGPAGSPYLPREETEALLATLAKELRSGRRAQVLRGGPGLGKTTLLRELGARLREPFQAIDVYYAKLDPSDFFAWVLHQIGAPAPARPSELELREIAARLGRVAGTLVLLIDEAQSLPADTIARLADVIRGAGGAIRVVAALDLDADPAPLRALPDLLEHRLARPLELGETVALLEWRLGAATPALRARFGPEVVRGLHRSAAGNPRTLTRLAGDVERDAALRDGVEPGAPGTAAPTEPRAPVPGAAAPEPRAAARAPTPAAPEVPSAARGRPLRAPLPLPLQLVAPVALGAGVPLALFALWLWLAPLFTGPRPPAHLAIQAPPGTALALDGRFLGEAPLPGVDLAPGVHSLRAVLPDGVVLERRVVVWPRGAAISLP